MRVIEVWRMEMRRWELGWRIMGMCFTSVAWGGNWSKIPPRIVGLGDLRRF